MKPMDEDETPMPLLSKIGFKTLPLWDFEDIYNEDADPLPEVFTSSGCDEPVYLYFSL